MVHCTFITLVTNYFHYFLKPVNIRKYLNIILHVKFKHCDFPSLASLLMQVRGVKFDLKKPIHLEVRNVFIFYMLQQCKELLPLCLTNKQANGKSCNIKNTEVEIPASLLCTLIAQFLPALQARNSSFISSTGQCKNHCAVQYPCFSDKIFTAVQNARNWHFFHN